jgi:aminoglycoside phosphotransferase (APT) family kinase protein
MEEIREATTLALWRQAAAVRPSPTSLPTHNEGFTHRDLKAANLVFDASAQLFLLDLEGLEFVKVISSWRAAADLERLARSTQGFPNLTHQDRMNFLRRYCRSRSIRITAIYERKGSK